MAHKVQELFHEFANKINAMNNAVALPAVSYLGRDLISLTEDEKAGLLQKLKDIFEKLPDLYLEVLDADDRIMFQLGLYNKDDYVIDCFDCIIEPVRNAGTKNMDLLKKIINYKPDDNFEHFIKQILNEALEFDQHMAYIAQKLEQAKDLLRKQGLYPKKRETDA